VRDISKMLASNMGCWGQAIKWCQ